ncbi:MAG: PAS domain S-box protein, partial [Bacillota bacterium]|nr:PAS domain S-box protein [Bacillota bacterium]
MSSKNMDKIKDRLDYETLLKILDYSHDEIYITDAKGTIIYVNNACERHYGEKASEVIGKDSSVISKKSWNPRISPLVIEKKTPLTLEQKTCLGKTLLTTAIPILDDEGNVEYIVENSRDISETEGLKLELANSKQLLKRYKQEVKQLRKKEMEIPQMVTKSPRMQGIMLMAERVANIDSTVLVLGESGTGKGI